MEHLSADPSIGSYFPSLQEEEDDDEDDDDDVDDDAGIRCKCWEQNIETEQNQLWIRPACERFHIFVSEEQSCCSGDSL